jgi:hypothetical protein
MRARKSSDFYLASTHPRGTFVVPSWAVQPGNDITAGAHFGHPRPGARNGPSQGDSIRRADRVGEGGRPRVSEGEAAQSSLGEGGEGFISPERARRPDLVEQRGGGARTLGTVTRPILVGGPRRPELARAG